MDKYLKRKKIYIKPAESPPPREEMSTSTKKAKQEELEVTGVSRSGRVRKKSSKLTDFESPDEIDPRYKRKADRVPATVESPSEPVATPKQRKPAPPRKPLPPPVESPVQSMDEDSEDEDAEEEASFSQIKVAADSDSDQDTSLMFSHHDEEGVDEEATSDDSADDGGTANSDDDDDDEDEGQLVMVDEGPKPSRPTNQAMSLYMLEKSTKKRLVVKDGKIVGRKKAQRKDKGKSRFTAYMLWAKEARKEIIKSNPDMDFSTTSKRLGELWGIVPNSEKYTWRRRAKRMSVKQKAEENKNAGAPPASQRKFINKASPPAPAAKLTSPPRQDWQRRQDRRSGNNSGGGGGNSANQGQLSTLAAAAAVAQQQQLLQQQQLQNALAAAATDVKSAAKPGSIEAQQSAGMFKAVGTAPVDVASHLKLLGESLLIIGERLKEHEGQIAVSGSFSVLLDSLLCAMAPLICLTQQVPELNGCPSETLSQTLDNIAYIMPGL